MFDVGSSAGASGGLTWCLDPLGRQICDLAVKEFSCYSPLYPQPQQTMRLLPVAALPDRPARSDTA